MSGYANTMNNSSTVIKQIQVSQWFEALLSEEGGIWETTSPFIYSVLSLCGGVYFGSTFLWTDFNSYSFTTDPYSMDSSHSWVFGMIVFVITNGNITHLQKDKLYSNYFDVMGSCASREEEVFLENYMNLPIVWYWEKAHGFGNSVAFI